MSTLPPRSPNRIHHEVAAVRAFNQFYTRRLGVLDQHLLNSPFSLSEARVMFELAHRDEVAAKQIGIDLGLDAGYISRIVPGFEENSMSPASPFPRTAGNTRLSLTAKGRQAFAKLDRSSDDEFAAMLGQYCVVRAAKLVSAMGTIEHVLVPRPDPRPGVLLRNHRPGDIGWVVSRHGAIYAQEYG